MIQIRKAEDRGHANYGWLDTYHTFSFADYYDPEQTGFRALRVINEDRVQPGRGFGTHPHRDMEIITYVLEGALQHKDSMGTGSVISPGEIQTMTAGTGITHSEFNHSPDSPVHLLQIWILPSRRGLQPKYQQQKFAESEKQGRLMLVASADGRDGSLLINQDVNLYATLLRSGQSIAFENRPQRHAWIQVARGELLLNGTTLRAGDGAAVSDGEKLQLSSKEEAEALIFDLN